MSNFNFFTPPPAYIQQQPPMGQIPQRGGRWMIAKNYAEAISTPIPADGSQTIFLMETEPRFFTAYMENGQKFVQGFDFSPIVGEVQKQEENADSTETRIQNLETSLGKILSFIEGSVKSNEPNTHANGKAVPTKAK